VREGGREGGRALLALQPSLPSLVGCLVVGCSVAVLQCWDEWMDGVWCVGMRSGWLAVWTSGWLAVFVVAGWASLVVVGCGGSWWVVVGRGWVWLGVARCDVVVAQREKISSFVLKSVRSFRSPFRSPSVASFVSLVLSS